MAAIAIWKLDSLSGFLMNCTSLDNFIYTRVIKIIFYHIKWSSLENWSVFWMAKTRWQIIQNQTQICQQIERFGYLNVWFLNVHCRTNHLKMLPFKSWKLILLVFVCWFWVVYYIINITFRGFCFNSDHPVVQKGLKQNHQTWLKIIFKLTRCASWQNSLVGRNVPIKLIQSTSEIRTVQISSGHFSDTFWVRLSNGQVFRCPVLQDWSGFWTVH
jgi:hypothetical protein